MSKFRTPPVFAFLRDLTRFCSLLSTSVTNGTHSVIQSTFAEPCIPIHETNKTINGFSSGLRDTVNGTAKTTLAIEVKAAGGENDTIWFFDMWGCGEGGVGAINANDSDWENFDAFVRNAKRLNGTGGDSNSGGGTFTGRPTSSRPVPTTTAGSSAERVGTNTVVAIAVLAPLLLTMFAL